MKPIATFANGAVKIVEDAGVFSIVADESVNVGGGQAAGIVKIVGSATITLDAETGLKLGESLLNSHLPAAVQPLALVVEGVANQAIKALE